MSEFRKVKTNENNNTPARNHPDKNNCKTYASNKNPYSVYRPDDEYKSREGYERKSEKEFKSNKGGKYDTFKSPDFKNKDGFKSGDKNYELRRAKKDGYIPYDKERSEKSFDNKYKPKSDKEFDNKYREDKREIFSRNSEKPWEKRGSERTYNKKYEKSDTGFKGKSEDEHKNKYREDKRESFSRNNEKPWEKRGSERTYTKKYEKSDTNISDKIEELKKRGIKPGAIFDGRVVGVKEFGVFVNILPRIDGMVHISNISEGKKIENIDSVLKVGDEVIVKVLKIDFKGRIDMRLLEKI